MNPNSQTPLVAVVDYGMGNLRSIAKALDYLKAEHCITRRPADLARASHIILPGVGHFAEGMRNLKQLGLIDPLANEVAKAKPLLGICLGMQLLFESSQEGGAVAGLGYLKGEIRRFQFEPDSRLKIPHIGWNEVTNAPGAELAIMAGLEQDANFYFIHSYHAVLGEATAHALTDYGYGFVSAVQKQNVCGTQFHPEKSQKKGLRLLKNFLDL